MSINKEPLDLADGTKLHWMEMRPHLFLNQMTMLYGSSRSGKTVLLLEIMEMMKDLVTSVFIVCPSNEAQGAYDGIVPARCIKSGANMDATATFLRNFFKRQKEITNIYKTVNNLDKLRKLFDKCFDTLAIRRVKYISQVASEMLSNIENNPKYNMLQKKAKREKLEKDNNKLLSDIYKTTIKHFEKHLFANDLSDEDKTIIKYINLVPFALLIFDDFAPKFKLLNKKDPEIIKDIFYAARQYNIATMFLTQSDKEIASEYRINVMCSIFTTQQSAMLNFDKKSNGYPPNIKKRAELCVKAIFDNDSKASDGEKNYKKLVYIDGENDPFRVHQAEIRLGFKMGSASIWKYADKLEEKNKHKSQKQNSLLQKYR
jgi:hypothetical protein